MKNIRIFLSISIISVLVSCGNPLSQVESDIVNELLLDQEWYYYSIRDNKNYAGNTYYNELKFNLKEGRLEYDFKYQYNSKFEGKYAGEKVDLYYDDDKNSIIIDAYRGDEVYKSFRIRVKRDSIVAKLSKHIDARNKTIDYFNSKKFPQILDQYMGGELGDYPDLGYKVNSNKNMKGIFTSTFFIQRGWDYFYYNRVNETYPNNFKEKDIIILDSGDKFTEKYFEVEREIPVSELKILEKSKVSEIKSYFKSNWKLYETNIFEFEYVEPREIKFNLKQKPILANEGWGKDLTGLKYGGEYHDFSKAPFLDFIFDYLTEGKRVPFRYSESERKVVIKDNEINFIYGESNGGRVLSNGFAIFTIKSNPKILFFQALGDRNKYFSLIRP